MFNPEPHIYMFWGVNDSYLPEEMNREHKSRLRRTVSHDFGYNFLLAVPLSSTVSSSHLPVEGKTTEVPFNLLISELQRRDRTSNQPVS